MAALTPEEQQDLWRAMNKLVPEQNWNKQQINAAVQAVEDLMTSQPSRQQISNAIEGAAPGVFTGQVKEQIFISWSASYARRNAVV